MRKTNKSFKAQEKTPFQEWLDETTNRDAAMVRRIYYFGSAKDLYKLLQSLYLAGWGCDDAYDFLGKLFTTPNQSNKDLSAYIRDQIVPLGPDLRQVAVDDVADEDALPELDKVDIAAEEDADKAF